jgi:hypothetical protein
MLSSVDHTDLARALTEIVEQGDPLPRMHS